VTSPDVMWTSIAEVMDAPPEARMPPGLFTHIAHRRVVMVLDNLEQLPGAAEVVADLLDAAPHLLVVATSRRPLHVLGEHEHPVPPLELPEGTDVEEASASGAVQMFVQHARMVRPGFAVTAENAADVVAVCRRLDGLPLAIELAAARVKLLSPHALLVRLDSALDIAAPGSRVASRQKTLRDTIGWSYDLLTPGQQEFFCRLGVFAGGADLDAINAVIAVENGADALDLVADLVDASLLTVSETAEGEPRIGMLETIHEFAYGELAKTNDGPVIGRRHAEYYLGFAERLSPQLQSPQVSATTRELEAEHDNFRQALAWSMEADQAGAADQGRVRMGLRLCAALRLFWAFSGYFREGEDWFRQIIQRAGEADSLDLAHALTELSQILNLNGNFEGARANASAAVGMCRRLPLDIELARALSGLGGFEIQGGDPSAARPLVEEALNICRAIGDSTDLHFQLVTLAWLEESEKHYEVSLALQREAFDIVRQAGNISLTAIRQNQIADTLRRMGRLQEAVALIQDNIPAAVQLNHPALLMWTCDAYAAILAELHDYSAAIRLLGTADALHERHGVPRDSEELADISQSFAKARAAIPPETWDQLYATGLKTSPEKALTAVLASDSARQTAAAQGV
jgi:predicted ATPase